MKKKLLSIFVITAMIFGSLQISFALNSPKDDHERDNKKSIHNVDTKPATKPMKAPPANAKYSGSYVLAVIANGKFVVEPTKVEYENASTVKDAVRAAENYHHTIKGLEEGYITEVDGVVANYMRFYDEGNFDLEADLKQGKTLSCFVLYDMQMDYSNQYIDLLKKMAKYETYTKVQKAFPDIKVAHENAIAGAPSADSDKAEKLAQAIVDAEKKYDAWQSETDTNVTLTPKKGSTSVEARITLTDSFGQEFELTGKSCEFKLKSGTYNIKAEEGFNQTTGTIAVEKGKDATIDIPIQEHDLFGEIKIAEDKDWKHEAKTTNDPANNTITAVISDYTESPYIRIKPNTTDYSDIKVYGDYTDYKFGHDRGDEAKSYNRIPWDSTSKSLLGLLKKGNEERSIKLKAVEKRDNFTLRQFYNLNVERTPGLSDLVAKENGAEIISSFTKTFSSETKTYNLELVSDKITISTKIMDSCKDSYTIKINEDVVEPETEKEVAINDGDEIKIELQDALGHKTEYKIKVTKKTGTKVVLQKEKGVSCVLVNEKGSKIRPVQETDNESVFKVLPGEYEWDSTIDKYYHAKKKIKVENSEVKTKVETPKKGNWIKQLEFRANTSSTSKEYKIEGGKSFKADDHDYTVLISDEGSGLAYVGETVDNTIYTNLGGFWRPDMPGMWRGETKDKQGPKISERATFFIKQGVDGNEMTFNAKKVENGVTYYQNYDIRVKRTATIKSLEFKDDKKVMYLFKQTADPSKFFDIDETEYDLPIPSNLESINMTFEYQGEKKDAESIGGKYYVDTNGQTFERPEPLEDGSIESTVTTKVNLDTTKKNEDITITVRNSNTSSVAKTYVIHLKKIEPTKVRFNKSPMDAVINFVDKEKGERIWPDENGDFSVLPGKTYSYSVTAFGYVGQKAEFTATDTEKTIDAKLTLAKPNEKLTVVDEGNSWPFFRADQDNNGVVNFKTPIKAEDTVLYWANKAGTGFSNQAVSCPIVVNDYLYAYSGDQLLKFDTLTGEKIKTGSMDRSSNFAINSPAYADGMIFVGLSNGGVQAFNADTLESLWIYNDPLKGQPNCPIVIKEGKLYTGFWNSETKQANFVCMTITDEDPTQTKEEKTASWTFADKGFYWAGAHANNSYIIVGTDDGESGYQDGRGDLLSFDPKTGKMVDRLVGALPGDIRSSVVYDKVTDAYYFTSKGGEMGKVQVNADGTFDRDGYKTVKFYNKTDGTTDGVPMSTCSPVVYNGRAYVGVSGKGQFTAYSGHNMTVVDLESMTVAYIVPTKGYPQTSGLLTTAYEKDTGYVYVYFQDNYTPGMTRMLKDRKGQTAPEELYPEEGTTQKLGYNLFTPTGNEAQYAICSPIADRYGNIYFKNDSANMMMIGSTVKELKVVKQPDKLKYKIGETFNPRGMKVEAIYTNGVKRDVTRAVKYTQKTLTIADRTVELSLPTMYQNRNGKWGETFNGPDATVKITVEDTTATNYQVSFDTNGGDWPSEPPSVEKTVNVRDGESYTLPECKIIAPKDKEFIGWEIETKKYNPGDVITINGNKNVKALWGERTYEVIITSSEAQAGESATRYSGCKPGDKVPLKASKDLKGKEFREWRIVFGAVDIGDKNSKDTTATIKSKGTTQSNSGFKIAIEAVYETKYYTVSFETNATDVKFDAVKVKKDYNLKLLKAPTRKGYSFAGWYTDKELKNEYDFTKPVTNDIKLFAKWMDQEKPIIKIEPQNNEVSVKNGATYELPKITVEDNQTEPITPEVIITKGGTKVASVDTDVAGEYTVTINAKDKAGNSADAVVVRVTVSNAEKDKLQAIINEAKEAKENIKVSADGKDVEPTDKWTTAESLKAFNEAIEAAEAVMNDANASQKNVDAKVLALKATLATFKASLSNGTKGLAADKTNLQKALENAENLKKNAPVVSTDGKDVNPDQKWTSAESLNAFNEAIEAAKAVMDDTTASQSKVNAAVETLNTAIATFKASFKDGAKVNKTELDKSIKAAEKAQKGIKVSTDGKDVEPTDKWTTSSEMNALNEAIKAAKAVNDDTSAKQPDVDKAKADLDKAIDKFKASLKAGKKEATAVDKTELDKSIKAAEKAKKDIKESTDGKDVDPSEKWTTSEEMNALNDAITAAKTVNNDTGAKQPEVDKAKADLDKAIDKFKASLKAGEKTGTTPGVTPGTTQLKVVTEGYNDSSTVANGNRVIYVIGDSTKAVFRIVGDDLSVDDLESVLLDGQIVDRINYNVRKGSIIVSLKKSYVDSLKPGTHKLTFNTTKGIAYAELVVKQKGEKSVNTDKNKKNPIRTGDNKENIIGILIMMLIAGAMAEELMRRRKER